MTFLKRVGLIVSQVARVVVGLGPLLPSTGSSKIDDTLENVAHIVLTVESVGQVLNTSGTDKLKAATPLVAQVILRSDMMIGKKISDDLLFKSGCELITDGMVKILNSLKDEVDSKVIPR